MVATNPHTGNQTEPVAWGEPVEVNGVLRPNPLDPQIGSVVKASQFEQSVQVGYVKGGTDTPPAGQDGKVEQLDNAGEHVDLHPGEVALIAKEQGPNAALLAIGGPDAPAGDPQPVQSPAEAVKAKEKAVEDNKTRSSRSAPVKKAAAKKAE